MYIYESKTGPQKVAVGTVTKINTITKDGVEKTVVTLEDWNKEQLSIWFNNKPGEAANKQMSDRVVKAKVKENTFLACLVLKNEDQKDATGLGFQYKGIITVTDYTSDGNESEINVIIGPGCRPREIKEGIYSISMPVGNKEGDTDWYSVSFFDSDKNNLATNAKKLFNGERRYCAVRCGKVKENEVNGNVYKNLTGYYLQVAPFVTT